MSGRVLSTVTAGLFADFRLRRAIRKAARVELSSLDENTFARVSGTVQSFDSRLLEAPVSARLCVYYSLTVTWRRNVRQDMVAVLGAGVLEPDPDAPPTGMYRDSGAHRLRFTGTEKPRPLITNDPTTL